MANGHDSIGHTDYEQCVYYTGLDSEGHWTEIRNLMQLKPRRRGGGKGGGGQGRGAKCRVCVGRVLLVILGVETEF